MSEPFKSGVAMFVSAALLMGMAWVGNNIGNVNETLVKNSTRAQQFFRELQAIKSNRWTSTDARHQIQLNEMRYKILEERLTLIEEERKEYITMLQDLVATKTAKKS